jgi:hypothetical protein
MEKVIIKRWPDRVLYDAEGDNQQKTLTLFYFPLFSRTYCIDLQSTQDDKRYVSMT